MTKDIALLERQGTILFNFWLKKQQNNKHIGELTVGDFIELCKFIADLEGDNTKNQKKNMKSLNDNFRNHPKFTNIIN
jgi:ssRNA-specific RNase YbeY (16S rRNA maturation enzyme)